MGQCQFSKFCFAVPSARKVIFLSRLSCHGLGKSRKEYAPLHVIYALLLVWITAKGTG